MKTRKRRRFWLCLGVRPIHCTLQPPEHFSLEMFGTQNDPMYEHNLQGVKDIESISNIFNFVGCSPN